MLFQGTAITLRAAITNIRRFGKAGANIPLIKDTGRRTFATGPAKTVFTGGTIQAYPLGITLMLKSQEAVIEGSAIGAAFFERDVFFHLFGDGRTIFV